MTLDVEDLDRLYKRYANALLRFFQLRVADAELATDLMTDTFATALERRAQYRGSSEQELSGWLWAIARSTLREHGRRGAARKRRPGERGERRRRALTDEEIERIEDDANSESLRRAVRSSLEKLPPEQREAVRLRVIEGLSYKEVARRLRINPTATRMRVMRGMQAMRAMLEPIFEREEDRHG